MTNQTFKTMALLGLMYFAVVAHTTAIPMVSAAPDASAIYTAKCAKCHGSDGSGTEKYKKKGVKNFTDEKWQKSRSDAQLTASINKGKGDVMPGWSTKLSAEEIKALVGLVRAFGKK